MSPQEVAALFARMEARFRTRNAAASDTDTIISDPAVQEVIGHWPPSSVPLPHGVDIAAAARQLERLRALIPSDDQDGGRLDDVIAELHSCLYVNGSDGHGGGPGRPDATVSDIVGRWPPE